MSSMSTGQSSRAWDKRGASRPGAQTAGSGMRFSPKRTDAREQDLPHGPAGANTRGQKPKALWAGSYLRANLEICEDVIAVINRERSELLRLLRLQRKRSRRFEKALRSNGTWSPAGRKR